MVKIYAAREPKEKHPFYIKHIILKVSDSTFDKFLISYSNQCVLTYTNKQCLCPCDSLCTAKWPNPGAKIWSIYKTWHKKQSNISGVNLWGWRRYNSKILRDWCTRWTKNSIECVHGTLSEGLHVHWWCYTEVLPRPWSAFMGVCGKWKSWAVEWQEGADTMDRKQAEKVKGGVHGING